MPRAPRSEGVIMKEKTGRKLAFLGFIAPAFLLYGIFFLLPLVTSLAYSFANYDGFTTFRWIGFGNYQAFLTDPEFFATLRRTLVYTACNAPFKVIIPLLLALLTTSKFLKGKAFVRSGFYVPVLLSALTIGMIINWMFSQEYGLVNFAIQKLGGKALEWALNPALATAVISIASNWMSAGFFMVVFIGGIQEIPPEIYEASEIDGAGSMQRFWRVTLPMLRPTMLLVLLLSTNDLLKEYALVQGVTQGGPGTDTTYLIQYIYEKAFHTSPAQYGYASAISVVAMALFLLVALLQFKATKGGEID